MSAAAVEEAAGEATVEVHPGCAAPEINVRGIPGAQFIESEEEFLAHEDGVENAMKTLQEQLMDYKYLFEKVNHDRRQHMAKVPAIEKTLEMVRFLISKKDVEEPLVTHFELADHVYANAELDRPETVCVWLGANVMLEYPLEEAKEMLEGNLATAKTNLANTEDDLRFIKSQITTMEVNLARIFNYDVRLRRRSRETGN